MYSCAVGTQYLLVTGEARIGRRNKQERLPLVQPLETKIQIFQVDAVEEVHSYRKIQNSEKSREKQSMTWPAEVGTPGQKAHVRAY